MRRSGRGRPVDVVAAGIAVAIATVAAAQQEAPGSLRWVTVAPGSFDMGCTTGDAECYADELPSHRVTLSRGFAVMATEATRAQLRSFAQATGRTPPPAPDFPQGDDHPAVNLTWDEAAALCAWVGGRLPTEAEWEYAARGGRPASRFPNGDTVDLSQADFAGTGGGDSWTNTAPVAAFPPNGFGLYDMAGNVWEWCADYYTPAGFDAAPAADPAGSPTGNARVMRGGAWNSVARGLRVSNRGRATPASRLANTGVRCVLDLAPPPAAPPAVAPALTPPSVPAPVPEPVASPAAAPMPAPPQEGGSAMTGALPTADAAAAPAPGAGARRRFPPAGAEMAWVPAGEFEQGCVRGDADCDADEQPRHHVVIANGFWLDVTEVTVGRFEAFAAASGRAMPQQPEWNGSDHPVVNVTWEDASSYCRWAGGRLPSEAEWEYAARGGVDGLKYPAGAGISVGEVNGDGTGGADGWDKTAPVGSFPANGFGLSDMIGNVWEWCADWFDAEAYRAPVERGPAGAAVGSERVVRGGSWTSVAGRMRISYRFRLDPADSSVGIGFRCARDS